MTYYYTLHDEGTDYDAVAITSKEGETISQFGRRILSENEFEDRKCVVYPAGAASKAFARPTIVADHFNQHQHGTSGKPFRVELQHQNDEASALPSHFTPVLLKLAVNGMDGWDKTTSQRTKSESSEVRTATVAFYGLSSKKHCQILGENTKHVVDAHIWPHHNRGNLVLVELNATDIDDPKNVLRLHKSIEGFFDHKQLTFTQSGADFLLKVLDPSIRTVMLEGTDVTLNDIEGKPLVFPNGKKPWRRLLATHSIISLKHARQQPNWLEEDELTAAEVDAQELMEFSLDAEAQARVRRFLQT